MSDKNKNTGVSRRDFLKAAGYGLISVGCCSSVAHAVTTKDGKSVFDYRSIMHSFFEDHSGDIYLNAEQKQLFQSTFARIKRVQRYIGFGNFNLISHDRMVKTAKYSRDIGAFTRHELAFIEQMFYLDARELGFRGEKVVAELDATIQKKDVKRVRNSGGHYLFRGDSLDTFQRAKGTVGDNLILTSGVRGVAKQIYLFLNKVRRTDGNLSRASRSVAPPGYSFHGSGDFDIGQRGLGNRNFTHAFSRTDIHYRLVDQGIVEQRYPVDNPYGVRYEPWHIKIPA